MPFLKNQGVRIHYEVEGEGPPLVLQHGFTDSLVTWYERGYVDALKYRYRVILVDARGHHESDKPHEEDAYAEQHIGADIVAVMDDLGINEASYFGYSMGGLIGFALGKYAPERFPKMVIGGASPYPFPTSSVDPMMSFLLDGSSGLLKLFEGYLGSDFERRILRNDLTALIACRTRRFKTAGFESSLSKMTMPCLLYAGDADPIFNDVKRATAAMPNAQFFCLPGYKHVQGMMEAHAVLPRVISFLGRDK